LAKIFRTALFRSAVLFSFAAGLSAEEERKGETRDLIFTYIGPVAGYGFNRVTYKDWFSAYQGVKKFPGQYYTAGLTFNVYAKYFAGDFAFSFMNNKNDKYPIRNMFISSNARVLISLGETFFIAPGGGIYFETPPASRKYNGSAGIQGSAALGINATFNTKLYADVHVRYGSFGLGRDSTKLSYGISAGFVYKVGRM